MESRLKNLCTKQGVAKHFGEQTTGSLQDEGRVRRWTAAEWFQSACIPSPPVQAGIIVGEAQKAQHVLEKPSRPVK